MIWFLSDLDRLARERSAIAELQAGSAGWLTNVVWRLETTTLALDADIVVKDRSFPVTLTYPYAFPHCPPSVAPRGVDERWSFHQYGRGGELCLEWGPDNWVPEKTGADMLVSAFRLLTAEYPDGGRGEPEEVPSRHLSSLAQDVRGRGDRFIATRALLEQLSTLPAGIVAETDVSLGNVATSLAVIFKVRIPGQAEWRDKTVPVRALDGLHYRGAAVRLPSGMRMPPLDAGAAVFREVMAAGGINLSALVQDRGPAAFVLVLADDGRSQLVWMPSGGDGLLPFSTIVIDTERQNRLPPGYTDLAAATVGIVGCGSLGSKVAVSLARAGVSAFVLIDNDIFYPENLVRHELDWRDIGMHKTDALRRRLALVNPAVKTKRYRIRLDGQEANGDVAGALKSLSTCSVVIDATANPSVFNMLAAVAGADERTMIWAEVFAGGIGGMIARYRPGETPSPQRMRAAITAWYHENNIPWEGRDSDYETASPEGAGTALVADDADVTAIAVHVTRMAIETLTVADRPVYPHAVYVLGLKPGWLFEPGYFNERAVKLLLPVSQIGSLKAYLRRAGSRETGGLLMGEQLAADEFRVAEFSFNRRSGSLASFTRDMRAHRRALEKFFRKTGHDFQRFNYLGEWHSHPHFPVTPSASDIAAMQAIVNDRAVGANFAALLIVRLRRDDTLEIGPYLFVPGKRLLYPIECEVVCESSSGSDAAPSEESAPAAEEAQADALARSAAQEDADGCCS